MKTNTTANRPTYRDPLVVEMVAAKIAPKVIRWLEQEDKVTEKDKADILEQMKEMVEDRGYNTDGYELAKYCENHLMWTVDSGLVEVLDDVSHLQYQSLQEITTIWVKDNNISCPFTVGQKVTTRTSKYGADVEGTISEIYADRAQVSVSCPSLGHLPPGSKGVPGTHGIIKDYEEVTAVDPQ